MAPLHCPWRGGAVGASASVGLRAAVALDRRRVPRGTSTPYRPAIDVIIPVTIQRVRMCDAVTSDRPSWT